MKSNALFNKTIYLMAFLGIIGLSTNSTFSQQVKKKIVRIVEVDDKGEHVVKEFNVTNDDAKLDSITHDVRKKIKIEKIKMDSLKHVLRKSLPNNAWFPPMPPMPDMPEIEFGFDMPEAPFFDHDDDNDFEFFTPDSAGNAAKIYYSDKNFDKNVNLDKILEDLEKGTFDPQKWNMREVEKDKIKDFKTNGKGEVIVFENRPIAPPPFKNFYGNPHRKMLKIRRDRDEAREGRNERRMIYFNGDSLDKANFENYTIESSDDFDGPNCEKVVIVRSDGKRNSASRSFSSEGKKNVRKIVVVNDNKTTKLEFTKPSVDEMKMLEKSDLMKEDNAKLLSPESLMLFPKEEKDKYTIRFQEKEAGKVKFVFADNKGKAIKTEEFDYSSGKTEKDIELKDLKSGVYFIQAQLNGKTVTVKMELKIE